MTETELRYTRVKCDNEQEAESNRTRSPNPSNVHTGTYRRVKHIHTAKYQTLKKISQQTKTNSIQIMISKWQVSRKQELPLNSNKTYIYLVFIFSIFKFLMENKTTRSCATDLLLVCQQLCANTAHRHHQQVAKASAKAYQNTQTLVNMAEIPSLWGSDRRLLQCVGWMGGTL